MNLSEEKPIPKLPEEIINAIDDNRLLLFVGAGVSKLIGYPLWIELAKGLVDKCVQKGVVSLSEKEILLSGSFNPMQIVTIASKRLDGVENKLGISSVVEQLDDKAEYEKGLANKIALFLSNYYSPIITTNADRSLELSEPLKDRVVLPSFEKYNEDYNDLSIMHLHGSVEDPESMVFTSQQYARAYTFEAPFGRQLIKLFDKDWTILFIGYGVGEFDLLRYFLKKKDVTRRLFMLSGYLDKDAIKLQFDSEYYDSLGITLLPYSREKEDYFALVKVLEHWDKDVTEKTFASSRHKKNIIDSITSKSPTDINVEKILNMVNKNG